jgi:hypothetical protein
MAGQGDRGRWIMKIRMFVALVAATGALTACRGAETAYPWCGNAPLVHPCAGEQGDVGSGRWVIRDTDGSETPVTLVSRSHDTNGRTVVYVQRIGG